MTDHPPEDVPGTDTADEHRTNAKFTWYPGDIQVVSSGGGGR